MTVIKGDIFGKWTQTGTVIPVDHVKLLAPVDPPNIIALGLNYKAHAEEGHAKVPASPVVFLKATSALTHPQAPIVLPPMAPNEVDYEAELVVVMGKTAKMRLNGNVMQKANTSSMIFNVFYLVSYLSRCMTLFPGTVIMTGTPAGVGCMRTPPVWLQAGDRVEVEIEGIGVLCNTVVKEVDPDPVFVTTYPPVPEPTAFAAAF